MKKNKMMRAASALLVAVLLTTSVISGTFAKYVTTASGSDTARVAKWGFKTTELAVDMFDDIYDLGAVDSSDSANVIAPGTTKTAHIVLVPSEQVAPEVKYNFEVNLSKTTNSDTLFNKLVWSLNGTEVGTFEALNTAIDAAYSRNYAPGELPISEMYITWAWPFYLDDATDTVDTGLGNEGAANLTITLEFTATQLDN